MKDYPFEVRSLTAEEGGGYFISYPDFDMCVSDGETIEEAIANGKEALQATIAALEAESLLVPEPTMTSAMLGKFLVRVPKTLHAQLANRCKREGVSLNTLVVSYMAAGVASHV